jgi:hypothetical protein
MPRSTSTRCGGILDRLAVEDFAVENGDRPVREVALEVLVRVGWALSEQRATAQVDGQLHPERG